MAIWTNRTKSNSTFTNKPLAGVAAWDDSQVAWDSPLFNWDAVRTAWVNRSKAIHTSFTTDNPFFGWLFLFTQSTASSEGTVWTNKTKH